MACRAGAGCRMRAPACACRRNAQDRLADPRQLGRRHPRARQAGRHLSEARPRSRHPLHPGRRRDAAGRRLRRGRRRPQRRGARKPRRLWQGRAHPHHRRELDRIGRDVLVGCRPLALAFDTPGQRPEPRLFHQRLLLPYRGAAFHQRIRPQGATGRHRRQRRDHHPGDVGTSRRRLGGGAVRARPARQGRGPHDRARQRYRRRARPDHPRADHQRAEPGGEEGRLRALHEGLQRDRRLDVFQSRGGAALSRVFRPVGTGGPAHAQGLHPEGEPADGDHRRPRREHEGRRPVQVPAGAARRKPAQD